MNPARSQTRQRLTRAAGYLLLGELAGLHHLVGGALIIGGGLWAARGANRRVVHRS